MRLHEEHEGVTNYTKKSNALVLFFVFFVVQSFALFTLESREPLQS
jgi:hypothetical protein